jgi:hypothetical protein
MLWQKFRETVLDIAALIVPFGLLDAKRDGVSSSHPEFASRHFEGNLDAFQAGICSE